MKTVREMKPGQQFRINEKLYELLRPCGVGSAYVKELGTERAVKVFEGTPREAEFVGSAKRYTISPESEIDEVLS